MFGQGKLTIELERRYGITTKELRIFQSNQTF